jgi:hypothetical protein
MVAMGEGHDHDTGGICPMCQFRERLAEFLEHSHDDGREAWHTAVGDLRLHIHGVLLALDAIESQPFDDDPDPDDDPAEDAASAIAAVGAEIEHLWRTLMGKQGQGD